MLHQKVWEYYGAGGYCYFPIFINAEEISTFSTYRGLSSAAPENLPVATKIANEVICLPMHHELSGRDLERILSLIVK